MSGIGNGCTLSLPSPRNNLASLDCGRLSSAVVETIAGSGFGARVVRTVARRGVGMDGRVSVIGRLDNVA